MTFIRDTHGVGTLATPKLTKVKEVYFPPDLGARG